MELFMIFLVISGRRTDDKIHQQEPKLIYKVS